MSEMDLDDDDYQQGLSDNDDDAFDYEEGDDDEAFDDDLGFVDSQASEAPKLKAYEVEYTPRTPAEILAFQRREVEHVAGITGIAEQHVATLLRHFNWNKERLIELYMDQPEKVLSDAGVITDEKEAPRFVKVPGFMCDVCCNDDDGMETLALSCGHRFCRDCYEHYLTQKIRDEGESRRIQCMGECKLVVDEKTVEMVVDKDTFKKYQSLLLRTFVDDNEYLKWCPSANCENAVECHVSQAKLKEIIPTVICASGHRFCFGCSQVDHQPTLCALLKLWMRKCQDDSETANWISANTKECPRCKSTIEKNGGCNHMTCKQCKYEWCWICMGSWTEHGQNWYNCNRFEEKSGSEARDAQSKSRASLERYLHYFNRYANHEQSARLDQELYLKTERKMDQLQQSSDLSWIEVQFLKKAVDVVVAARMTLKYTYAFAFYLVRDNPTHLFEDNQRDLEMAVEQLSELLEKPLELNRDKISELRQWVLDKSVYVQQRREIMLNDTAQGLLEKRWTYNVNI
ncbi:hypothetical protein RI367_001602 [Sorochytrium milnesiophthora]